MKNVLGAGMELFVGFLFVSSIPISVGGTTSRALVQPEAEHGRVLEQPVTNRNAVRVDATAGPDQGFRCEDGFFRCNGTLQCIEQSKNCNGFPDCDDGSDELECDDAVGRDYYDHLFRKQPAAINDHLPYT
uniref:Uncharacterized protein n=1 Tax=Anopheles atroparvus TaxID=41427 RepID=A0AAG5D5D0_ANOAO